MKERLDSYEIKIVLERTIEACRKYGSDSIGVIAHRLDCQRNSEWSNTSNGNCVLVIVRGGQIKTVYLRRSTQTFDLELTAHARAGGHDENDFTQPHHAKNCLTTHKNRQPTFVR